MTDVTIKVRSDNSAASDFPVVAKTANYTVVDGDIGKELSFASGSPVTASLTAAATLGNGFEVVIRNAGAGSLTIDPDGSETLDGQATVVLATDQWRWIRSDGSNWKSIAGIPADSVTDAMLRDSAALSVIGRAANSTGNPADIVAGSDGDVLRRSGTSLGFGTVPSTSITGLGALVALNTVGTAQIDNNAVTTGKIADDAVTYAKIQNVSAASKLLGRGSADGAGDVEEISLGTGLSMSGTTLSVSSTGGAETGDLCHSFRTSKTGWVPLSGRTIGNGSSGATERANADTSDLFTLLWNNLANSEAAVSGGRGASAAADFAANKTLTLPDARGRAIIGFDSMGGTDANRVTSAVAGFEGSTLGASGGDQRMQAHSHTGGGNAATEKEGEGDFSCMLTPPENTGTTGAGNSQNMPPSLVGYIFIKL
jgi:hypothetical protein